MVSLVVPHATPRLPKVLLVSGLTIIARIDLGDSRCRAGVGLPPSVTVTLAAGRVADMHQNGVGQV
ncbi:MAG TPA: hypothetical protein VFQ80_06150 [Thermomicrobiales bacterium]|jgi:hypothetical protein|nr:hypothetical protein [Thermomicrobiales bacterium]